MSKKTLVKQERPTLDLGLLDDGTIVIQFDKLVKQMTFTPEQAKSLGVGFIEMATHGASVQRMQPPGQTAIGPRGKQ
jgi:hypothetical protein